MTRAEARTRPPAGALALLLLAMALSTTCVRARSAQRSYEDRVNCRFGGRPVDLAKPPSLAAVTFPHFPGGYAIWGSTGRDSRGRIWFGVSASGVPNPSARLFEYQPDRARLAPRGDVVAELRRSGVHRSGEGQMKIHSRIVEGADGSLYFASMDEQGEETDGSKLPTWGSHLWRVDRTTRAWEHLLATREALIAVSSVGRYVYALGYFDHVLYQLDSTTRRVRSVHVGALGGHISRNFVADEHGHAYVPRLAIDPAHPSRTRATLVELDASLAEIAETPLDHYTQTFDDDSHGIVAFHYMADHSIVFATDRGFLYRIVPAGAVPAKVEALGFFHPLGEAYVASLFTTDGNRYLVGASRRQWTGDNRYEWLVHDLVTRTSVALPLAIPEIDGAPPQDLLLYGSMARDDAGRFYLAGTYARAGKSLPVVLQATLAPGEG